MKELKPISQTAIPKALDRAIQYRLLNEPWQAESICLDILAVNPDHQQAIIVLVLAITDQFESTQGNHRKSEAMALIQRLDSAYHKLYYTGIIVERQGMAALKRNSPRGQYIAYDGLIEALEFYKNAQEVHPDNNEDSILRWNACVRMIEQFQLKPSPESIGENAFTDM